jgi:hypothetical protein
VRWARMSGERTAIINQIRCFLLEHGLTVRQRLHWASRPARCSIFSPGSIPMVTTAVSNLRGMAWFLLLIAHKHARWLGGSTAGPSHSRTWRRKFIAAVAATAVIESCTRSRPKNPLIGSCFRVLPRSATTRLICFREGLRRSGRNDGQVQIAARFAENESARNRLLTNKLLGLEPIVVLLDPALPRGNQDDTSHPDCRAIPPAFAAEGIVAVAVALNVTVEVMEVRSKYLFRSSTQRFSRS